MAIQNKSDGTISRMELQEKTNHVTIPVHRSCANNRASFVCWQPLEIRDNDQLESEILKAI